MKILILTEEQYPKTLGGGTTYLNEFEKGMKYYNHDYEIWATKFYKGEKELKNNKKIKNLGINLIGFNHFFARSLFKVIYYAICYCSVITNLIKKRNYKNFDAI